MAKHEAASVEAERRSPVAVTVGLLTAFVLLAIVGVVTVVMPELSDAGDDEETEAAAASDPPQGAASPPAGSAAPGAPAPAAP